VLEEPRTNEDFAMFVPVRAALAFGDVSPDAPYAEAVDLMSSLGIINGLEAGIYGPEGSLRISHALVFATRIRSFFEQDNYVFEEISPWWYSTHVAYAQQVGIPTIYEDDDLEFLEDEANASQMASIILAILPPEMLPTIRDINEVSGLTPSDKDFAVVLELARAGIFDPEVEFLPNAFVSRAEAVLYFARLIRPDMRLTD
jgi:hypothetical protein